MIVPATNTLTPDFKDLIEAGAASDPEAVRRFRFASDMEWMERLRDKDVYFVFDIWVNKSSVHDGAWGSTMTITTSRNRTSNGSYSWFLAMSTT